ncbi:MAG: hypothetical protein GX270_13530 [Clostridiaceae bacterium]|nr:hypothetical protein [Clostridiaceae bacterium]
MKNLKKMLASLVVVAMMASMALVPAFAATLSYEKEAEQLNKVGLYLGISETEFIPDLETLLDRQTGVVMLLRMFGQEEEAKLLSDEEANSMLAKFTDAGTIADWAKKQVAYAVDKGVVKGYAEDSTFRPSAGLNGKAYCSLLLQQLGYDGDFDYHQAATKLAQVGGLNASQAALFNSDAQINKDSLVGISYGALQAKTKADGKKLVKLLLENEVVKEEDLNDAEIPYADITAVAEIADITVDVGAEVKLPETVTATYDNGTTADVAVTWPTVDTSSEGEQTITGTIADTTITASVKVIVVPAELRVTGEVSGNRKEIILNFNRAVEDADKAKNVNNYRIKKYKVQNVDLSADKMTATLLLEDGQLFKQQEDVTVTVDKDVGLEEDTDVVIKNIKDVTPPEVESVVAVGNSLIKVTFTEPVQNIRSVTNYTIDGKAFPASKIDVAKNLKVVSIHLKNKLASDTHTLVVKDKVADYAGFKIEDNETEFTVVDDNEAPTAEIESATQTKVVVKFSEPVKKPADDDVDTSTTAKITKRELDDDDITYTIEFDREKPLPASGGKLTMKNVEDYSGNKTDIAIVVEPDYDLEKPEYVGYKVAEKQTEIIVEFSEDIIYEDDNFELVNADGDDVIINVEYEKNDKGDDVKNKVVITRANDAAFASEKHKLTIDGVKDNSPIENEIDKITVTIEIDDQEPPKVEEVAIDYSYDSSAKEYKSKMYIRFNEDIDFDTAVDYNNYTFQLAGDKTIYDLDKDFADIDLLSDERTILITFDREDTSKKDQKAGVDYVEVEDIVNIQIDSVEDTAGNEMKRTPWDDFKDLSDGELIPLVLSAKVTGENTIAVKLENKINDKTLSSADFSLYALVDSKQVGIEAYDAEYKYDDDEIILSINQDLAADGTYKGGNIYLSLIDPKDIDTVNAYDQVLDYHEEFEELVEDGYNPTIDSVSEAVYDNKGTSDYAKAYGNGTYAVLELTEALSLPEDPKEEIADVLAAQFSVKVGSDAVDKVIYYAAPVADDENTTKDESKPARLIIKVVGDKAADELAGKFIKVSFTPVPNSAANKAAGLVIADDSDAKNPLQEKGVIEKKISLVK